MLKRCVKREEQIYADDLMGKKVEEGGFLNF